MAPNRVTHLNVHLRENGSWVQRIRKTKRHGLWYWKPSYPIEYVATGSSVENGTGDPLTVPFPAGIEEGDFLIVLWHSRQSGRRQTWPDGWTVLTGDNSGSGTTIEFGYRFYEEGDEEPEIVSTTDTSADNPIAQMAAFRNVDRNPLDSEGAHTLFATGLTSISDVDAPVLNYNGDLVIAAVNWRFDRTCSATAADGDGQTWDAIGNRTSVEASHGGFRWDYCITPEDETPTITDKDYTFSGNAGGGKAMILSIAQDPRPSQVNEILREDLCVDPDPVPLWKNLTTADPNEDATNWQITQETVGPSPYIPVGQEEPSGYYRRTQLDSYRTTSSFTMGASTLDVDEIRSGCPTSGVLSVGNGGNGGATGFRISYTGYTGNQFTGVSMTDGATGTTYPTGTLIAHLDEFDGGADGRQDSYRAMCIAGSQVNSFYVFKYGDVLTTMFSVAFDEVAEDAYEPLEDGGSQFFQWKAASGSGSPNLALQEYASFLRLRFNPTGQSGTNLLDFDRPVPGDWMRFAVRTFYHPSLGTIEMFSKYYPDDPWELMVAESGVRTIFPEGDPAGLPYTVPSFGPYQKCDVSEIGRNYADLQIVRNWDGVS